MLEVNSQAPAFKTPDESGFVVHSDDYKKNKNIVLYFYPKDDTPGCTIEANQFTKLIRKFAELDTVVYGVSKDDSQSHVDFIKKFDLQVGLLADTDGSLCESYGVWQEKEKNGVKKMGIVRSTFIINKAGDLIDVEYGVKPDGHAQQVLDKLRVITQE